MSKTSKLLPKNSRWAGSEGWFTPGRTVVVQQSDKFLHVRIVKPMSGFRFKVRDGSGKTFDVGSEFITHIMMA